MNRHDKTKNKNNKKKKLPAGEMAYLALDNKLGYFKDTETGGTEKSAIKRVYLGMMLLYDHSVMLLKPLYGNAIRPHSYLGHEEVYSIPTMPHISWVPIGRPIRCALVALSCAPTRA